MRAWMKRHKILTGVLALLLVPVTLGGLNYSGMCLAEGRWLSDEEKIRRVVAMMLARSKSTADIERFMREHPGAIDVFLSRHTGCCAVNPGGPYEIPPPSFIDRITGYNSADVIVSDFEANPMNGNGTKTLQHVKNSNVLMNCGQIKW